MVCGKAAEANSSDHSGAGQAGTLNGESPGSCARRRTDRGENRNLARQGAEVVSPQKLCRAESVFAAVESDRATHGVEGTLVVAAAGEEDVRIVRFNFSTHLEPHFARDQAGRWGGLNERAKDPGEALAMGVENGAGVAENESSRGVDFQSSSAGSCLVIGVVVIRGIS